MAAQGQAHMAIVLDHFAAGGHQLKGHREFAEFRDVSCLANWRSCKARQRFAAL